MTNPSDPSASGPSGQASFFNPLATAYFAYAWEDRNGDAALTTLHPNNFTSRISGTAKQVALLRLPMSALFLVRHTH